LHTQRVLTRRHRQLLQLRMQWANAKASAAVAPAYGRTPSHWRLPQFHIQQAKAKYRQLLQVHMQWADAKASAATTAAYATGQREAIHSSSCCIWANVKPSLAAAAAGQCEAIRSSCYCCCLRNWPARGHR
jgi:DNA mismatch repair protein MutH